MSSEEMEGRKDISHSFNSSDELEDDSGLELSLGLSFGGLRNKCKALEGATALEFAAEHESNGVGALERPKYVRRSGLESALKKFLEGRLDEQEDLGRLLDGYPIQKGTLHSNGNLTKDRETPTSLCSMGLVISPASKTYQEKGNQRHSVSELDSGGNPVLSKVIQLSDGVTVAWGQVAEQAFPLPFTDALKTGSVGESLVLRNHFAELLGNEDGDKGELQRQAMLQTRDSFEQQRNFQEARQKRKDLIGEQKQQKKVREEDGRTGPHGFRRPGSNVWAGGFDAAPLASDAEKALLGLKHAEEGEQCQQALREGLPLEKVRANERSFEVDRDKTTGIPGEASKSLETNLIPQLEPQDAEKFSNAVNGQVSRVPEDTGHLRIKHTLAAVKESLGRTSSSTGTDITEEKEEQSCGEDCEASSAPSGSTGSDTVAASICTASPHPSASFSVMPMPHSNPTPALNASGMAMSVGFSFPHLMQSTTTSDCKEQSSEQPVTRNTFQLPSEQGYPAQIPALEGCPSWIHVLGAPRTSPFTAPNSGVACNWTSTGVVEKDNRRPQGAKIQEKGIGLKNAPSAADKSVVENQPLYRSVAQDPAAALSESFQAPDLQCLSSSPIPVVPPYGPLRTLSDPRELHFFKEQGGINAFPGFAASAQEARGLSVAPRPPSNRVEDEGLQQEQVKLKGKVVSAALQEVLQTEDTSTTESKDLGQEDFRQFLAQQFQQGNADHFPMPDGLAKELANLRPVIPIGLKFGGTGSSPDLPWVSTTGSGPNGKTVCGVLYSFSRSQVKIVCACHGKHMSPSEFVQHAGGVEVSNPEKNIVVNHFF